MQICEVNKSMLGRSIADAQPPCCYPSRLDQFSITEKDAGHCNQRAKDEFAAADFFKSHRVSQQSRRHQTGQIFRLFIRLQGEKYEGTGVGLAIVQKGVERMGGRVGVESDSGQGSRFWIELRKFRKIAPIQLMTPRDRSSSRGGAL